MELLGQKLGLCKYLKADMMLQVTHNCSLVMLRSEVCHLYAQPQSCSD